MQLLYTCTLNVACYEAIELRVCFFSVYMYTFLYPLYCVVYSNWIDLYVVD